MKGPCLGCGGCIRLQFGWGSLMASPSANFSTELNLRLNLAYCNGAVGSIFLLKKVVPLLQLYRCLGWAVLQNLLKQGECSRMQLMKQKHELTTIPPLMWDHVAWFPLQTTASCLVRFVRIAENCFRSCGEVSSSTNQQSSASLACTKFCHMARWDRAHPTAPGVMWSQS